MKTEIEIQQEKVNTLIKLMKENPTLRVLPMVDTDVVGGDDYSCWLGVFGMVEIDECWSDEERIYFKSTDDEELVDRVLEGMEDDIKFAGLSEEELVKIAEKEVEELDWEKVITISIKTT